MRSIDTHAHLDFAQFDKDRDELLDRMCHEGVGVINVGVDEATSEWGDKLSRERPLVWSTIGAHPDEICCQLLSRIMEIFSAWEKMIKSNPKIVAIGEVGLDYHSSDKASQTSQPKANSQKAALRQFVTFSLQTKLPLVLHCREAYGDLLTLLGDYEGVRGVIHCFSGNKEEAKRAIELGLMISFTANITYPKNQDLRDILAWAPLEKIMLETDAPFLAPQAKRGERNDPFAIEEVAKAIAEAKKMSLEEVYRQTTKNAQGFFALDK